MEPFALLFFLFVLSQVIRGIINSVKKQTANTPGDNDDLQSGNNPFNRGGQNSQSQGRGTMKSKRAALVRRAALLAQKNKQASHSSTQDKSRPEDAGMKEREQSAGSDHNRARRNDWGGRAHEYVTVKSLLTLLGIFIIAFLVFGMLE